CVKRYGERLQRDHALNHMCNQSNGEARRAPEPAFSFKEEASTRRDAESMARDAAYRSLQGTMVTG
ncbi:hypothetical protein M9458_035529, partial [Cirrhinus mrigala]